MTGPSRWQATVGVLVSAAAYYLGTGLEPIAPLAWVAPIPVLVLALRSPLGRSAAMAFSAYLLGSANLAPYLLRLAPPVAVVMMLLVPALVYSAAVLAFRYAALRWRSWASVLVFAGVWTSYEYLLSTVSPSGTAVSLAYSQAELLVVVQLAAVTGIWGITFLVTLLPAGVALAWHERRHPPLARPAIGVPVGLVLLALIYGWTRLAAADPQAMLRVGAAATDRTVAHFDASNREEALPVLHAYARRIGELARRGAQVVVLPEKLVGVTPTYEEEAVAVLADAARQHQVIVVAGLNRIGRDLPRNTALVLGPDGRPLVEYDKAFLVPGFEAGYARGRSPGYLRAFGEPAGVAICKDMDFPQWLRRYAAGGVRIVFVPAWDFVVDGLLHARMAVFRGVEGGFAVVRSAQEGRITVSDPWGRIVAERASSESDEVLLSTTVSLGVGRTLYNRAGDAFAIASLMLTVSLLAATLLRARRSTAAGARSPDRGAAESRKGR